MSHSHDPRAAANIDARYGAGGRTSRPLCM